MVDSLPSLAFLGAGSMGGAILQGVVASGVVVDGGIVATNRTREKADALASLPGVTSIALEDDPEGNRRAASARIILVGVKPAMVPDLLREIAPALREALGAVRPAATMVVAGLTEPEMKVEIEVTAFRG